MKRVDGLMILAVSLGLVLASCELNPGVDFMELKPTPASSSVVEGHGLLARMNLGWYDQPFANPNVVDAMVPPAGPSGEHVRQKRWHFLSFMSDRFIIGIAAVDATYMANAFVYIFDFWNEAFTEFSSLGPSAVVTVSGNSISGETTYRTEGLCLRIVNEPTRHTVTFSCDQGGDTLTGTLVAHEESDPFVQAKEVDWRHIVYTHQNSMCAASGTAFWNCMEVTFDPETDFAGSDYTVGIQNYETFWNWASGTGYAADGTPLAVNLGGEAIFWIGDSIHRTESVSFTYGEVLEDWTIRSGDGSIDLTFQPVHMREGHIDVLGVIASDFLQPFGTFTGRITGPGDVVYEIDTMVGVTEEHFARW